MTARDLDGITEITRDEVIAHLEQAGRGDDDAARARTELPKSFDIENPPPLVGELGVNANLLLSDVNSGGGDVPEVIGGQGGLPGPRI